MAITKTTSVLTVEVIAQPNDAPAYMNVHYVDHFDDPDDNELPRDMRRIKTLYKTTVDDSDPENLVDVPTDVSGESALVQTIAAAIWAE